MKDLSEELTAVYSSKNLDSKKEAFITLINNSHGKAETKQRFINEIKRVNSTDRLDFMATNYMFSGEGMSVNG